MVLEQLISKDKENKYVLASSTRIKLALNRRKVTPIREEFEAENAALIKEYGTPYIDPKSGNVVPESFEVREDNPKISEFRVKQKALLAIDTDVVLSPVSVEELVGPFITNEIDPKTKGRKLAENQIPIDLLDLCIETGLVSVEEVEALVAASDGKPE